MSILFYSHHVNQMKKLWVSIWLYITRTYDWASLQLFWNLFLAYTGTRLPRYRSKNDLIYGCWINQPRIGILCKKTASVGQKPLKSTMNPYDSKIMPTIGHPMTTKKKPTPNEIVPLKFWRFMKNCMVDFGPMVRVTPEKKSMFPMASNPLSKKKIIPRNEKNTPNPVSPNPIFFRSFISKETIFSMIQVSLGFTVRWIWRRSELDSMAKIFARTCECDAHKERERERETERERARE